MAECALGLADRAYETYRASMPAAYNERAEVRQIEPYVQGQTTYSIFSPRAGNCRTPWLTGAAAWAYFSATQAILGIRPEIEGLRLDPCIPSSWKGFEATRRFRGCEYRIQVRRTGQRRLVVDGRQLDGNLVPPQSGPTCNVLLEI
jgi:cellobiose phosphorylase